MKNKDHMDVYFTSRKMDGRMKKSVVLGCWEFGCVGQISTAVIKWAVPHKWREGYWWSSLTKDPAVVPHPAYLREWTLLTKIETEV